MDHWRQITSQYRGAWTHVISSWKPRLFFRADRVRRISPYHWPTFSSIRRLYGGRQRGIFWSSSHPNDIFIIIMDDQLWKSCKLHKVIFSYYILDLGSLWLNPRDLQWPRVADTSSPQKFHWQPLRTGVTVTASLSTSIIPIFVFFAAWGLSVWRSMDVIKWTTLPW